MTTNKPEDDFESWFQKGDNKRCEHCGHNDYDPPEWPDQQRKIKRLVEKQLGQSK